MLSIEEKFARYDIRERSLEVFYDLLHTLHLKKGEPFIEIFKKNDKLGIIKSGLLIAKYVSDKGVEEVSRFYHPEDSFFVSNHESFYYNKESTESIVAFEDSEVLYIKKSDLESLYKDYPELTRLAIQITEEIYINAMRRIQDLQSLTGKERVEKFFNTRTYLVSKLNKQDMASFLGLNRNDFSKYLSEI